MSYMKVECIRDRSNCNKPSEVGNLFLVDRESIYMDTDGDTFGFLCNLEGDFLYNASLNRFKTVEMTCFAKDKKED